MLFGHFVTFCHSLPTGEAAKNDQRLNTEDSDTWNREKTSAFTYTTTLLPHTTLLWTNSMNFNTCKYWLLSFVESQTNK